MIPTVLLPARSPNLLSISLHTSLVCDVLHTHGEMVSLPAEFARWLLETMDDEAYPKLYGELESMVPGRHEVYRG